MAIVRSQGASGYMEINGRFWGSLQLTIDAGNDVERGWIGRFESHHWSDPDLRTLAEPGLTDEVTTAPDLPISLYEDTTTPAARIASRPVLRRPATDGHGTLPLGPGDRPIRPSNQHTK